MKRLSITLLICFLFPVLAGFAQTPTPTPTLDAEKEKADKEKADAEYQKKLEVYKKQLAEIQEKNKKIAETNALVIKLLKEGNLAFQAEEYELAIRKYREAETLDDYWGMIAVILTNKSIALRIVGVKKYNAAIQFHRTPSDSSQPYFVEAVSSLEKALRILDENVGSIEPDKRESFSEYKFNATRELAECYRLFLLNDICETPKAVKAYENYISLEKDEILKAQAEGELQRIRNTIYICGK